MEAASTLNGALARHAAPANPTCFVVKLEGIDTNNINNLAEHLTNKLCTDLHGNFYIKGAGFGQEGRQVQLREVVELRDALLEVIAIANGKTGTAAPEAMKQTKNVGKARAGQTEALNRVIEERMDGPIRDLQTKTADLESKLRETNEELKRVVAENVGLTTAATNSGKEVKNIRKEMVSMVEKAVADNSTIKKVDEKISSATTALANGMQALGEEVSSNHNKLHRQITVTDKRLTGAVSSVRTDLNIAAKANTSGKEEMETAIQDMREEMSGIQSQLETVEGNVNDMWEDLDNADTQLKGMSEDVADVREGVDKVSRSLKRVDGDVDTLWDWKNRQTGRRY